MCHPDRLAVPVHAGPPPQAGVVPVKGPLVVDGVEKIAHSSLPHFVAIAINSTSEKRAL